MQKHLRDIKASRYGPNYACNQESSLDFEQFDLPAAATKDANSPADDSEVSDAREQHLPTRARSICRLSIPPPAPPALQPPVLPGLYSLRPPQLDVTTARNCALDSAVRLGWSMCCTR